MADLADNYGEMAVVDEIEVRMSEENVTGEIYEGTAVGYAGYGSL